MSPVTEAAWANEPLPPRLPSSMYFLALSQAPPLEVMAMAMNSPVTIVPTSTPPRTTGPERGMTATAMTKSTGKQGGNNHLAQRRLRDDVDADAVFRLVFTAQNSGLGGELAAHFPHDRAGGFADRIHAEGGEDEGQQAANEEADDHLRIVE